MVKTVDVLTHPTPARLDALFTVQGPGRMRTQLRIVFTILPCSVDDSTDHPMPIIHDIDHQPGQIHPRQLRADLVFREGCSSEL